MDRNNFIGSLYKILPLYECAINSGDANEYLAYLSRLYVRVFCLGNEEIKDTIKGLLSMGITVSHEQVRRVVFHMINAVEKGGE